MYEKISNESKRQELVKVAKIKIKKEIEHEKDRLIEMIKEQNDKEYLDDLISIYHFLMKAEYYLNKEDRFLEIEARYPEYDIVVYRMPLMDLKQLNDSDFNVAINLMIFNNDTNIAEFLNQLDHDNTWCSLIDTISRIVFRKNHIEGYI